MWQKISNPLVFKNHPANAMYAIETNMFKTQIDAYCHELKIQGGIPGEIVIHSTYQLNLL